MTSGHAGTEETVDGIVTPILAARARAAAGRAVLVAITGIDGAGKGYLPGAPRAGSCRTIHGWRPRRLRW